MQGAAAGNAGASPIARTNYAALLAAEIARHKAYPEAARAAGVTRAVGVALTVGPSGRIVAHTIIRSSGNSALDREVDAMMFAVQAPPPPGGHFQTEATIRFDLQ
jgi:periplasmic protein TonB